MTSPEFYREIADRALRDEPPEKETALGMLESPEIELLPLLNAAFRVRRHYWGREVLVHIINNVENGRCPEDCRYCAQSRFSKTPIRSYSMKSDEEIFEEARIAFEAGADRHCLVFSGPGPGSDRVERLCAIIRGIKERCPGMEVCVSPGVMGQDDLEKLKRAGLDRLNHNLNTSERRYPEICTTHAFTDRLKTLEAASLSGLDICSGFIAGLGESSEDLVDLAFFLRSLESVRSIPVNFLIPLEGIRVDPPKHLTPEFCLRLLCMMRFIHPRSEIRAAAGREYYLKSLEALCLFPANSIFMNGYLNVRGAGDARDLAMIRDAGFTVRAPGRAEDFFRGGQKNLELFSKEGHNKGLKAFQDLRPAQRRKPKSHLPA
jgi:biotin synthase